MTTTATETTRAQLEAVTVDAARLSWGTWDATKQKDIGEGDIHKAYSGDTISSGKIRGVVTIAGKPYTVTGLARDNGTEQACLWPLFTPAEWGDRPTTTYGDVTSRRNQEQSEFSYEGIKVKHGKNVYVMGARSGEILAQGNAPEPVTAPAFAPPPPPPATTTATEPAEPDDDDESNRMDDYDDDEEEPEPEEEPFALDPTPAPPAEQLPLFGSN
jgi:hypothetical protein